MEINGKTKVVGLFGWPISHTLSPPMHNAAFQALNLNWIYIALPLAPEQVEEGITSLRTFNFVGTNVTIPHKQAIMRYLDHVDPAALAIGAVNTVVIREDGAYGYNTDEYGFLQSLLEGGFNPKGKRCLVLGAGGAARAIVYSLANAGATTITICNRTVDRAAFLVDDLQSGFEDVTFAYETLSDQSLDQLRDQVDLVVNTTSVGMTPKVDASPWPETVALPNAAVCDLVYNPLDTLFLRQAREAGLTTIDGVGMLVHQGARSFEIWTGQKPPTDLMREIVIEGLKNR